MYESTEEALQIVKGKKNKYEKYGKSGWRILGRSKWEQRKAEMETVLKCINGLEKENLDLKENHEKRIRQLELKAESLHQQETIQMRVHPDNYNPAGVPDLMMQLRGMLKDKGVDIQLDVKYPYGISWGGMVVVPIKSPNVKDGLAKAQLDRGTLSNAIVVIFHHRAQHDSRIRVPTSDKVPVDLQEIVQGCRLMVDAVHWDNKMYTCDTNDACVAQIIQAVTNQSCE